MFFLLSWLWFQRLAARGILRDSFAVKWTMAAIAAGAASVVITEAAGAFELLTPGVCAAAWLGADGLALALVARETGGGRVGGSRGRRFCEARANWRAG